MGRAARTGESRDAKGKSSWLISAHGGRKGAEEGVGDELDDVSREGKKDAGGGGGEAGRDAFRFKNGGIGVRESGAGEKKGGLRKDGGVVKKGGMTEDLIARYVFAWICHCVWNCLD